MTFFHKEAEEDDDVQDGEDASDLTCGLLRLWVLHTRVLDVEVPAPVGQDNGQGAGDEGDDPDP